MEGSVYLKARQEWDERYADLVLGTGISSVDSQFLKSVEAPSKQACFDTANTLDLRRPFEKLAGILCSYPSEARV